MPTEYLNNFKYLIPRGLIITTYEILDITIVSSVFREVGY